MAKQSAEVIADAAMSFLARFAQKEFIEHPSDGHQTAQKYEGF
ncbi:hypothetical protein [Bdellovibrio bacteriovorus]